MPTDQEIVPATAPVSGGWRSAVSGIGRRISARPLLVRWILAGPVALILAILAMASMPFWFPGGAAGIDHIVFPIVLFPLIWTATVVYPCIDDNVPRAVLTMTGLCLLCGGLVASAFM
ncbi:MAG: hypothetical protein AAGB15_06815 [Pseudomonadota bacterium]